MKKSFILPFLLATLFLPSCARRQNLFKDVVTQTAARADASLTACSNLVQRGDFGIGQLGDGFMILVTGRFYQVDTGGRVGRAPADAATPFAIVTFFEADRVYDVAAMDFKIFKNTMDWKRSAPGRIHAVRIAGKFARLALAGRPELPSARGTMMGFRYPDSLRALKDPGYELYFLDEGRTLGGPVTDFAIEQGRIEMDECAALLVDLPANL